jgi:YD repeat-containing protein
MRAERKLFICLLLSLFLAACGGGGGGGGNTPEKKLLSRVVTEGMGERVFQYDDRNRLIADSALGEGNRIEYQGDDIRPSLVTNGLPYPTKDITDGNGNSVSIPIVYARYQYGGDSLNGFLSGYAQMQALDQNRNPIEPGLFYRYYLSASHQILAHGKFRASADAFYPSAFSVPAAYDRRGNVLKKTRSLLIMGTIANTWEYTYDDKKSPASGMVTPLWWFDDDAYDDFASDKVPGNCGSTLGFGGAVLSSDDFLVGVNNPLSCVSTRSFGNVVLSREAETYHYTYDQEGYPIAVDVTRTRHDQSGVEQTTAYRKTFEYIASR